MNDGLTISTKELFELIPDAEAARRYLEGRRWSEGVACTGCGAKTRITPRRDGFYRCNACKLDFTVRTGTIFERSHVALDVWIHAMYLLITSRKGISSVQLSKELSIRQGTTWFMLQRLRQACGNDLEALRGIVEIDECYIGGLEENKHKGKRANAGHGTVSKRAVLGMRERGGRVKAKPMTSTDMQSLCMEVIGAVEEGSHIHTDQFRGYRGLDAFYYHRTINHEKGEYHKKGVGTNSIESVWAVLKRGLHGVYHHASDKHLGRYVNEFTFRLNSGNVKRHTIHRLNSLVDSTIGARITYKDLTA